MSDIKPLNRTTKTLAHVSYLSIEFQPLYAPKGFPRCLGLRRLISCNIGVEFKERGEGRQETKYSTQTPKKSTLFSGQYLCNRSTLDIGVLGYIGIVWPKKHSPEVVTLTRGTSCIYIYLYIYIYIIQHTTFMVGLWPQFHVFKHITIFCSRIGIIFKTHVHWTTIELP